MSRNIWEEVKFEEAILVCAVIIFHQNHVGKPTVNTTFPAIFIQSSNCPSVPMQLIKIATKIHLCVVENILSTTKIIG